MGLLDKLEQVEIAFFAALLYHSSYYAHIASGSSITKGYVSKDT